VRRHVLCHSSCGKKNLYFVRRVFWLRWSCLRGRRLRLTKPAPFPGWSLEVVKFLVEERGITAIGHESLDADTTEKMATETYLLTSGHYQIEVMANLDKVPAKGALIVVS
jgi:kynurenine formamidase